ncbi:MAG: hypothetical protein MUP94_06255, partial [Flavobacteriales bacterium]|nr:hypothetical protein [Flavobacteriales bacterium]
ENGSSQHALRSNQLWQRLKNALRKAPGWDQFKEGWKRKLKGKDHATSFSGRMLSSEGVKEYFASRMVWSALH